MRDFEFTYRAMNRTLTTHRVQIYQGDNWTTIVATDQSIKHQGTSVTNSIEDLVTALVVQEGLNPERLVVIEHYEDLSHETWDLVQLERRRDGSFTNPEWNPIDKEQVDKWCGAAIQA